MFARIGKVLFLVGGVMAALLVACGSGDQVNDNPTTNTAVAKAAVNPNPGSLTAPTTKTAAPAAATINTGNGIAPRPTTTGEGDLFAFTPSSPPAASKAANPATPSAGMAGVAATVALAAMAAPPPPDDPVDPCRALPCSDDDDPWLGCRYAAALYRDAPGTVQGVRAVVYKMSETQLEWYLGALLESYRRDLWYSTDYRLGDPGKLEQTHRDVKAMVFGSNDDVEAMSEDVICGLLGSTEITLADVIAASRANSPFVAKKKAPKEKLRTILDPFEPDASQPAATDPGCGADPCPPPSGSPATGCGAEPCPPPAEPPAGDAPAAPEPGDAAPATNPPANPIPAEPPAGDAPAAPEPGDAAPPAKSGEGTVAFGIRYHQPIL